jgi:two-component system sensor histidine kinase BaeS
VIISMSSWWEAAADQPLETALAAAALTGCSVAAGLALQALTRRTRRLRHLVLAILIAALLVGALAALLLAQLMILDGDEARAIVGVLVVTAAFAVVLAAIATRPLGADAARLEAAVRRLEEGDRTVRTGVSRADELGHVAHALDELTERLDELERERAGVEEERRVMLTSVGHDLRTPLAALRAAIEALSDGIAPDPPRYLRSMAHDVEALTALVDDLFLLARIESGRLDLHREPLDLTELADDAVESMRPTAAGRGIDLRLIADGPVRADVNPVAIGRVVRNLVDNALQHAPAGSAVEIEVTKERGPVVRVIDAGDGFPAGFAEHAFDRFTRGEPSRSRASGGAGLGLAIARGLVEAHGGEIEIEPPPGGRVAVRLP